MAELVGVGPELVLDEVAEIPLLSTMEWSQVRSAKESYMDRTVDDA